MDDTARFSFFRGNEGLASLMGMDIDSPTGSHDQKNSANFFTRPLTYAMNSFKSVASLFTISPPTKAVTGHDLGKPILQEFCCRCRKRLLLSEDIFMYSDRQYCTAECRQVQLDIDFPPPKKDKNGDPSSSNSASKKRKAASLPGTSASCLCLAELH